MKTSVLTAIMVVCCVALGAAQTQPDTTATGKKKTKLGFYVGPTVKFSHMASQFGMSVGGQAALIINKHFAVGAFGNRLVTKSLFNAIDPVTETNTKMELEMIQYGLSFEYAYQPVSFIRLSADLPAGFGNTWIERAEDDSRVERSTMLSLEPRLNVGFVIAKHINIGLFGGYQFTFINNKDFHFSNKDLSSFEYGVHLKIGLL